MKKKGKKGKKGKPRGTRGRLHELPPELVRHRKTTVALSYQEHTQLSGLSRFVAPEPHVRGPGHLLPRLLRDAGLVAAGYGQRPPKPPKTGRRDIKVQVFMNDFEWDLVAGMAAGTMGAYLRAAALHRFFPQDEKKRV